MELQFTAAKFDEEVLKAEKPVLVDFYADWCGPCKMMAPMVEGLAKEYEGKMLVGKLNIDQEESIAVNYRVMTIPTLIVFKNGEEVGRYSGVQSKETIVALIEKAL